MKKFILFIVICALNVTVTLRAQAFTDSDLKNFCGNAMNTAIQEECHYYQLEVGTILNFDTENKLFQFTYTLDASSAFQLNDIFNAMDVEAVKHKIIENMITNFMDNDPSGRKLEALVNLFVTKNIPINVFVMYEKKVKLATATPEEFQKLASLCY